MSSPLSALAVRLRIAAICVHGDLRPDGTFANPRPIQTPRVGERFAWHVRDRPTELPNVWIMREESVIVSAELLERAREEA